jgi:peptidoglycan/xylan/chitin deacetylase (PgdA/CDA1 family)
MPWRRLWRRLAALAVGTLTSVTTTAPVAALTFDDGPDPASTPRLLELLARHRARATFFMVGLAAQDHPELVRQVAQAGHAIGNHSWDHPSFPLIAGRERREQLRAAARALAPHGRRLFRPPYGHQDTASRLDALRLGYEVVTWTVAVVDWEAKSADWMAERMVSQVRPGAILLLHDALFDALDQRDVDRAPMLAALESALTRLAGRYRFVTLPELLRHGRPHREVWQRSAPAEWLNTLRRPQGELRRYPVQPGRR